jgi:hypothetical protein
MKKDGASWIIALVVFILDGCAYIIEGVTGLIMVQLGTDNGNTDVLICQLVIGLALTLSTIFSAVNRRKVVAVLLFTLNLLILCAGKFVVALLSKPDTTLSIGQLTFIYVYLVAAIYEIVPVVCSAKEKPWRWTCAIGFVIFLVATIIALTTVYGTEVKTSTYYNSMVKTALIVDIVFAVLFGIVGISAVALYDFPTVEEDPALRNIEKAEEPQNPDLEKATDKLIALKKMRDQGLITEEEYENKRKDIVSKL